MPDRFVDVETVQDAVWSAAPTPTLLLLRPARDHKQFWFQKIDAHRLRWLKDRPNRQRQWECFHNYVAFIRA